MSGDIRREILSYLQLDTLSYAVSDKNNPYAQFKAVAVTQLVGSIFKKFEDPNPEADAKAIAKFLSVNKAVGTWEWDSLGSWDDEVLGLVKDEIWKFFNPSGYYLDFSPKELFELGGVGPGTSVLGGGVDFYTKFFTSRLTVSSSSLYKEYLLSILPYPAWRNAESIRFRRWGGCTVVEENRVTCVPKNDDISRTIASEPTLNMWFQLGMGTLISRRLRSYYGIDIQTQQDRNREMALAGSLDVGDSWSTIDLESASDSVSLKLIDLIFPKEVRDVLLDLRVKYSTLPDGSKVELNMISTMGNGYTFPLQTLIFASIVRAVYRQQGIPLVGSDLLPNFSVFGDDIIVRKSAYDRVICVLGLFGFKVNGSKSFKEGPFRESCGVDAFMGHNVRPVYIRRLSCKQDLFVAFNQLTSWSARTGVSLPSTLRWLLRRTGFQPVPPWESDDAGHRVPSWYPRKKSFNRFGSETYKASVPRLRRISFPHDRPDLEVLSARGPLPWVNNPGLEVAVLKGIFGGGVLGLQQKTPSYVSKRRTALSWDSQPVGWDRPLSHRPWLLDLSPKRDGCIAQSALGTRWNTVFSRILLG